MKAKNLLKKAFLLLALVGGATSAWADETPDYQSSDWSNSAAITAALGTHGDVTVSVVNGGSDGNVSGHWYKPLNSAIDGTGGTYLQVSSTKQIEKISVFYCPNGTNATNLAWVAWGNVTPSAEVGSNYGTTTGTTGSKSWDAAVWEDIDLSENSAYTVRISRQFKNCTNDGNKISNTGANQTVNLLGFKVWLKPSAPASAPTITQQPVSANYEKDDAATALSVTATASAGTLQYEWYSNSTESKEGATKVQDKSTTVTYTPSTSSVGTTYYYCKVYDTNGNTDSEFATVSVVNAIAPTISYSDPAVTITYAGSGTVYYTTDGSVPSSSNGTEYSAPFNLDNSCTVRAVVEKGGNSSDLVKYDCYVDQSSAANFLISTGYHSGTQEEKVWTSTDGNFTLTSDGDNMNWSNHIFPDMHGHKMDANTVYTLQPDADIKITSIKIVGRTWLNGTAATVAVSDATPASQTWLAGEDGNVSYILTKEFAVTANYGEAVTISPTGNQFGCFLEVYGVKRSGPASPEAVPGTTVTWDFSTGPAQTAAGTITAGQSNTLTATDNTTTITYVAGDNDKYETSNGYYLKPGGKSGISSSKLTNRYFLLNISKSGQLSLTSNTNKSGEYLIYQGSTTDPSEATAQSSITTSAGNLTKTGNIDIANGAYLFIGFGSQIYTESLSWTPETNDITLTTSANMAGWRAFYDASNGYTLDENTTAYVATAKNGSTVTMTPLVGGIPSGTPVILKTTSSADSYKMTLTKASVSAYGGTNLLSWETSAVSNKYRLGYGDEGVGFYPYSGTPSSGAVILDISSSSSRALRLSFGSITDINQIENGKIEGSLPVKRIVNGKLVIEKKGHMFNANGQLIK